MKVHTFKSGRYAIQHNGDYSGDVEIDVTQADISPLGGNRVAVTLPFTVLRDFIAEYVRDELIDRLEQAEPDALLFPLGRSQ